MSCKISWSGISKIRQSNLISENLHSTVPFHLSWSAGLLRCNASARDFFVLYLSDAPMYLDKVLVISFFIWLFRDEIFDGFTKFSGNRYQPICSRNTSSCLPRIDCPIRETKFRLQILDCHVSVLESFVKFWKVNVQTHPPFYMLCQTGRYGCILYLQNVRKCSKIKSPQQNLRIYSAYFLDSVPTSI